jgi:hypothetical protein
MPAPALDPELERVINSAREASERRELGRSERSGHYALVPEHPPPE